MLFTGVLLVELRDSDVGVEMLRKSTYSPFPERQWNHHPRG